MNRRLAASLATAVALVAGGCNSTTKPDCIGPSPTVCFGACTNLRSDNQNCGVCGNACGAGDACVAGTCAPSCQAGTVACGSMCIDPLSDPNYCGASGSCRGTTSGTACPPGEVCSNGACALSCQAGLVDCSGRCVNPATDPNYCGASGACTGSTIGIACLPGFVCSAGSCALSCQAGLVNCNGTCVDPLTDPSYCGASASCSATATPATAGQICPPGNVCSNGACALTCQAGLVNCSGTCVDPKSSLAYCGASGGCSATATPPTSGQACPPGNVCSNGACALTCQAGLVNCNGTCVDPASSIAYCGASGSCSATATPPTTGQVCPPGNVCSNGACALTCQAGLVNCGGTCVDPKSSIAYCGASGSCSATATPPTSGQACPPGKVCSNGACALSCQAGLVNCNGTCVDPKTSLAYCGAATGCSATATPATAGQACPPGNVCSNGACALTCQAGLVNCSGTCDNPMTDPNNCGGCGKACPPGDVCSNGACALTCQSGLLDCSGTCVDPLADRSYCGASATCSSAVSPSTTGQVCPAGDVCSGGGCALSCQSSLVNCNGTCVDPLSNATYCGASGSCTGAGAGTTCPPGYACTGGACTLYCKPGLVNCNGTCVDPKSDPTYCGASGSCTGTTAGSACGPSATCYDAACYPLCGTTPGLVYCAGSCIDPLTNDSFCGASGYCTGTSAGSICPPGQSCAAVTVAGVTQGSCISNCTWSPPQAPVNPVASPYLSPWPTFPFASALPAGGAYVSDALPASTAQTIGYPPGSTIPGLDQIGDLNVAFLPEGFNLAPTPAPPAPPPSPNGVYAVDAAVFVPANLPYDDSASIIVATAETSPAPADGSAVASLCPLATGGLRVELDLPRSGGAPAIVLYDQTACPVTAIAPANVVNAPPPRLTGAWHDFRFEWATPPAIAAGAPCPAHVLVDNSEIYRWNVPAATCAALTGTSLALASGPTSTAGSPAAVYWSNVRQFVGVGRTSPADCVP